MSFEEATQRLCAAISEGDLDVAEQALHARREALARGEQPGRAEAEAGQRALLQLAALKHGLARESARLSQLKTAIAGAGTLPQVDCRG